MLSLVYTSLDSAPMSDADLALLLLISRTNNARAGLTGVLLYADGQFLQVLEGPEHAVRDRFARIAEDPRHREVEVHDEQTLTDRRFPDWTMGFHALTVPAVEGIPGWDDYFAARVDGRQSATAERIQQVVSRIGDVDH